MNQFTWTFVDDFGSRNVVGIAHGAETGHLVVYCNSNIILIDFKVLNDYDYSFFIGDELFNLEIRAERKGKFSYSCKIDKKANTPRNKVRQQQDKKHWKQILALIGGLFAFVFFCSFGAMYLNQQSNYIDQETLLADAGKLGTVRIYVDYENQKLQHQYVANGKPFVKSLPFPETTPIVLENGLTLENEATFQIRYLPANPYVYHIEYSQPTDNQLNKWLKQALELQKELYPKRTEAYHNCLVKLAYEQQQLSGLSRILNQKKSPQIYQRLIKDVSFQNALAERCW